MVENQAYMFLCFKLTWHGFIRSSEKAMVEASIVLPPPPALRYSHKRTQPLTQWSSDTDIDRIMKINIYVTFLFIYAVISFKKIHI